jgi:hypothetical protein
MTFPQMAVQVRTVFACLLDVYGGCSFGLLVPDLAYEAAARLMIAGFFASQDCAWTFEMPHGDWSGH